MTPPDPDSARALLAHSDWLRSLARRLLSDEHRAEDAVQDTLTAAFERPPRGGAGRPWLATVLVNFARQDHRARARRAARERAAPERTGEPPAAQTAARLDLQRRVVDAVEALDEPYRTAIVLRFLDDLPPREVARRTGAPVKTVHTRIERGLAKLRLRLDSEFGRRETWSLLMLPLAAPGRTGVAAATGVALMSTPLKLCAAVAAVALVGLVTWRAGLFELAPPETRAVEPASAEPAAPARPEPASAGAPVEVLAGRELVPNSSAAAQGPAGEPQPVVVASFEGRVADERGGPVAGLVVRFRPTSQADSPPREDAEPIVSAADGRFEMPLPVERGVLMASGRGWASVVEPGIRGDPPPTPPVIVVAPAATFAGVVVDGEGRPLSDAELAVLLPEGRSFELTGTRFAPPVRRGVSDAQGRFAFEDVGALSGLALAAELDGYVQARVDLPQASAFDLRLELERLASSTVRTVAGRVVDAGGTPVEAAYVSLAGDTVRTDAAGGFVFELPESGREAILRAACQGHLPAERVLERLPDGSLRDGEPLVLVLAGEALSIAGRVLDVDGEPLAGAQVWTPDGTRFGSVAQRFGELDFHVDVDVEEVLGGAAGGDVRDRREVVSDAAGRFELRGLAERDYSLYAMHPRTQEAARLDAVPAGSSGVVLRLGGSEATAPVAGRVVTWGGEPVEGALIRVGRRFPRAQGFPLYRGAPMDFHATTDLEGRFRFDALALEGTQLLLNGEMIPTPQTVELGPGVDREDVVFRVAQKCHLRVVLTDPELADSLVLLDERGEPLLLTVMAGSVTLGAEVTGFEDGRSDMIQTDQSARTLVLYQENDEALRVPLDLTPGEVNEIRP